MTPPQGRKLRVGVVVNPIAGLGGRAGLKGSDDRQRLAPLVERTPWTEDDANAFQRGVTCLRKLDPKRVVLVTPPGSLGEDVVKRATLRGGPVFEIVRGAGLEPKPFGSTTADDTRAATQRLMKADIDLILFVGGDGTATDVARATQAKVPMLGVPAGVKMFSGVFAQTPEMAALLVNGLAAGFTTHTVDVVDLDEASYLHGGWLVRTHAMALLPQAEGIQASKGSGAAAPESEALAELVDWFDGHRREGVAYILGAGSTVAALKQGLGNGTPLGIDVWKDGHWLARDADEGALLKVLEDVDHAELVVSPTGSQGALLGRGTAQVSPAVLDAVGLENIIVVATPNKLTGLRRLFVDTGDPDLDREFPSHVKVRTDPWTEKVFPVARGEAVAR